MNGVFPYSCLRVLSFLSPHSVRIHITYILRAYDVELMCMRLQCKLFNYGRYLKSSYKPLG